MGGSGDLNGVIREAGVFVSGNCWQELFSFFFLFFFCFSFSFFFLLYFPFSFYFFFFFVKRGSSGWKDDVTGCWAGSARGGGARGRDGQEEVIRTELRLG